MTPTQGLLTLVRHWITMGDGRETLRRLRGTDLTCRTHAEAERLAELLSEALPHGAHCRLGLVELMYNGIEHGNLEIGCELKAQLLREQRLDAEVAARLNRAPYQGRRVHVAIVQVDPSIEIELRDEGRGFAWRRALAADLVPSDQPNGRGIALVRQGCFPDLEYRDPGNVAIVRMSWPS